MSQLVATNQAPVVVVDIYCIEQEQEEKRRSSAMGQKCRKLNGRDGYVSLNEEIE